MDSNYSQKFARTPCSKTLPQVHRCRPTQSNHHESWWNSKSKRETGVLSQARRVSQVRGQDRADHGSRVDGGVEPGEKGLHLGLLLWKFKLFSSEWRHTRFDTPCAHSDQEKSDEWYSTAKNVNFKKVSWQGGTLMGLCFPIKTWKSWKKFCWINNVICLMCSPLFHKSINLF